MKYLFDASALVNLVKKGYLKPLLEAVTLDLAIYGSLNAILKENILIKKLGDKLASKYIRILTEIFGFIEVLSIKGYETDIYEMARDRGLTIYDASYVVVAYKNKMILVTDDQRLRRKTRGIIETLSTEDLIEMSR